MQNLFKISLKKGKEKSVQRRHPWIFSGAINHKDKHLQNGDFVEVYDFDNQYLATGFYQNSSIAVRIFSFQKCIPDKQFWMKKLQDAVDFRKSLFLPNEKTNMYRLINGEGDGFPGLIIDVFNSYFVIQIHALGMMNICNILTDNILQIIPDVKGIYLKNAINDQNENLIEEKWIYGKPNSNIIASENGILFNIDVVSGQKTGFFIDQRESRALVGKYSNNKTVLNMFSYSGGFSLYALRNGAKHVDSVDISQKAINLVDENVKLLPDAIAKNHTSHCEDVFRFLDRMPDNFYDLIILDPPAFAKHHHVKEQGLKGYRNINKKAMEKIKSGGLLFTFSCSQAINNDDFRTMIFSASALANKEVRLVQHLQHAPDHPVSIYHPEGEYLKGLMLQIIVNNNNQR